VATFHPKLTLELAVLQPAACAIEPMAHSHRYDRLVAQTRFVGANFANFGRAGRPLQRTLVTVNIGKFRQAATGVSPVTSVGFASATRRPNFAVSSLCSGGASHRRHCARRLNM